MGTIRNPFSAHRYLGFKRKLSQTISAHRGTIDTDLKDELHFLACYDETKQTVQEIVDMPDRLIDLLIRVCLQNAGKLSDRKRLRHFDFLTDIEVLRLEQAIQAGYRKRSHKAASSPFMSLQPSIKAQYYNDQNYEPVYIIAVIVMIC